MSQEQFNQSGKVDREEKKTKLSYIKSELTWKEGKYFFLSFSVVNQMRNINYDN